VEWLVFGLAVCYCLAMFKDTQQAMRAIIARTDHDARVRFDQGVRVSITELNTLLASGISAKAIMRIERTQPIVPGISPDVTLEELKKRDLIKA